MWLNNERPVAGGKAVLSFDKTKGMQKQPVGVVPEQLKVVESPNSKDLLQIL